MRHTKQMFVVVLLMAALAAAPIMAQSLAKEYDDDNDHGSPRGTRIDRYLDVDVWTDHADGDYYVGDNIVVHFRTNREAFVAIYSIDSRGRVNLLFPTRPGEDNFVEGDKTYSLPGGRDNFDLVVTGPSGGEQIQAVASRERFPIPDWYRNSGLVCGDNDDRNEYLDWLNSTRFVRYNGQRFAYDRTSISVREWEPDYFRPIFYPDYPSWSVCGNIYIDYPWGGAVYVNGIYWGVAPLYIPRILVGWHTLTIYDPWGACWERDVHVSRYNTLVLDHDVVVTRPEVRSKYKEVREVGYRDPVKNGYPRFGEVIHKGVERGGSITGGDRVLQKGNDRVAEPERRDVIREKKYVHGTTQIVESGRGLETKGTFDTGDRPSGRMFHGKTGEGSSGDATVSRQGESQTVEKRWREDADRGYRGLNEVPSGDQKSTEGVDQSGESHSRRAVEVDRGQQSGSERGRVESAPRRGDGGSAEKRGVVAPKSGNGQQGKSEGSYRRSSGGESKAATKSGQQGGGKGSGGDSGKRDKR